MPVVTIYTWGPTTDLVGHASMQLSDNTYISWWPRTPVSVSNPESPAWQPGSYSEDYSNEGGRNGEQCGILMTEADERKIKEWWRMFKYKQYHFLKNNCCTAVFLALKEVYPSLVMFYRIEIWVPKAINMIADDLANGKTSFESGRVGEIKKAADEEVVKIGAIRGAKMAGCFLWQRHCSIM